MLGTIVNGVTALLFPMFASYRALATNDISLIRPWLMYWVVFGTVQFVESVFRPLTKLVPFYGLFKTGFLLYLVLPQTQGAIQLYQSKLEPWLSSHDAAVEGAFNRVANFLHNSDYARLLAMIGINVPKPPPAGASQPSAEASGGVASGIGSWVYSWTGRQASGAGSVGASAAADGSATSMSMTDALMSRFRLSGSPDNNLSAYLPTLLRNSENTAVVRNSLLGMIRSIDSQSGGDADAARSTTTPTRAAGDASKDSDEYDFIDSPQHTPPPAHETEIEREVEAKVRDEPQPRRRWI